MFGVSGPEFLVIVLVAILVIPSRYWPDVARFLATEKIKSQIDLERPIDELVKTTTDDILADFSVKRKKIKKAPTKKKTAEKKKQAGRKK